MLKALVLDCRVFCRYPRLFVLKISFLCYKLFTVSDIFFRRVGRIHGLSEAAALEISTPVSVLDRVYSYLGASVDGFSFVDLGCGYGDLLWYAFLVRGCDVVGVEANPAVVSVVRGYVDFWQRLQKKDPLMCARVHIVSSNLADMPLLEAVYWLSWTGFSTEERAAACAALRLLPEGAVVVTTTYPVNKPFASLQHRFEVPFFWGVGTVYIYEIVSPG
jgi:SAM-dependent methyltransferase